MPGMRYALIIAGGSGTRLWPMSRAELPKQLIPFIGGRSLLEIAFDRLEGLLPAANRYVCAGRVHREAVLAALPKLDRERFLGEPMGRDTLVAIGLAAAVLAARDPDAVIAVFTADHLIEPVAEFQQAVEHGFALAEAGKAALPTLVTFGITPTGAATGYGYLELDAAIDADALGKGDSPIFADDRRRASGGAQAVSAKIGTVPARVVRQFREKPPREVAEEYFRAGPARYLWNSGMFVWRAADLLDCIRRYEPAVFDGLQTIAAAWDTPRRDQILDAVYPTLRKISIDFAVMEPASRDASVRVAAIPMRVSWLDVGSWPSYAETCPKDEQGNALAAERHLLHDSRECLVASNEPEHLIAAIGCEKLLIIHTKDATLVCPADKAEQIKELHKLAQEHFGQRYV